MRASASFPIAKGRLYAYACAEHADRVEASVTGKRINRRYKRTQDERLFDLSTVGSVE